jgi:hypothetical protein
MTTLFYYTGGLVWGLFALILAVLFGLYLWCGIRALHFTFRVCKHLDRKWYKEPRKDFLKFWWSCTVRPPDCLHFKTKGSIYFNKKATPPVLCPHEYEDWDECPVCCH